MLSRAKIRLVSLLIIGGITVPSSYAVLLNEKTKREVKAEANSSYYKSIAATYERYRIEREKYIKDAKKKSVKQMEASKSEYNKLLASQKTLIANHTKKIEEIIYVDASGSNKSSSKSSASSSGSKTASSTSRSSSTSTVSKPSSGSTVVKVAAKPKVTKQTKAS
ncbi:MAG: hypothetical protein AAB443_00300 [Patescibacteria group bacterium]